MSTSVRRLGLQPNAGLPATDLDQKKIQDPARNKTKNIAVGVIIGLSLATAAYLGHGYFFGKTQPDFKSRACEQYFIFKSQTPDRVFNDKTRKWEDKPIDLPGSPEFIKAHSDYLKSEDFKECIEKKGTKNVSELFTKLCEAEAYKSHWMCV